jgi:hypothetical protein
MWVGHSCPTADGKALSAKGALRRLFEFFDPWRAFKQFRKIPGSPGRLALHLISLCNSVTSVAKHFASVWDHSFPTTTTVERLRVVNPSPSYTRIVPVFPDAACRNGTSPRCWIRRTSEEISIRA